MSVNYGLGALFTTGHRPVRTTQVFLSFVLDSIGEDHGAIDGLFNRFENEVVGLSNKGRVTVGEIVFLYPGFPLRLYTLRNR